MYSSLMLMIGRIVWRLVKSSTRVLLVGWSPKPPPDFEARLIAVEHVAEKTRQKVYRDGKAQDVASDLNEAPVPLNTPPATEYWLGPRHSDGTPVQHGDPAR